MWCTRWFLPLLLLPIPTASPYFLLLFLFSLTLHAKPCFYCVVLLTTLFLSSCYWQPFPLDSPLSIPWSDNITTFADALQASLSPNYTRPLPTVIRAVDRCWCDFSEGNFFEPFNISNWEHASVEKLRAELEHQPASGTSDDPESRELANAANADTSDSAQVNLGTSTESSSSETWNPWAWFPPFNLRKGLPLPGLFLSLKPSGDDISRLSSTANVTTHDHWERNVCDDEHSLLFPRKQYDLRCYGLELVLDFGWS